MKKKEKCVCGNFFCILDKKKAKCSICNKLICKTVTINCNLDKKKYCILCYIKSFWDSLDKKEVINYNDLVLHDKKQTEVNKYVTKT